MLNSFRSCALIVAAAMTLSLLSACGDDGSNDKKAEIQIVSNPTTSAHPDYKALLLSDE